VRRLSASLAFALVVACGSIQLREVQQCDTLYFGTARPGGVVSDAEWRAFVEEIITPRFPGFTEWNAEGHWKREHESTHVVQIVHPPRGENNRLIEEIIAAYRTRFQQEAVFWLRDKVTIQSP
jgi:hypothetical protein